MTNFQIVILESKDVKNHEPDRFEVEQQSGGKKVVAKIDELADIWDAVVEKLTTIAAKTKVVVEGSPYELDQIEFNIGIEAGLEIGLVTKGNASVSVAFKKKS